MTQELLIERFRSAIEQPLPLPGGGQTPLRHARLLELGREDLSLARLAEAHWDAVAILAEAGRQPVEGALYGVWASEIPGQAVACERTSQGLVVHGTKRFCSGAGIVDRALLTVVLPEPRLLDLELRGQADRISFDESEWRTQAFAGTATATATFHDVQATEQDLLGGEGWYTSRPGFWHGACGPAACWAGGALGLVDYAMQQRRDDPHTLAHLGAMQASAWALRSYLEAAGKEIDEHPLDAPLAVVRALGVRHLVEQACTDILRRVARAFGPHPLAMNAEISKRYQELDLYVRQSHAERDLEALGRAARERLQAQR